MVTIRTLLALCWILPALWGSPTFAAIGDEGRARPERASDLVVEGRVASLSYRVAPEGHPLTDVVLAPGGESFTMIGGYLDGALWIAEPEGIVQLGEWVRVRLEERRDGLYPQNGALGFEGRSLSLEPRQLPEPSRIPEYGDLSHVHTVEPSRGPAAADGDIRVVLTGDGFGEQQRNGGVFFQGFFEHVEAEIVTWSQNRIECRVPAPGRFGTPQIFSGAVKVWTEGGGWSDGAEWFGGAGYDVIFQHPGDSWAPASLPIEVYADPNGFPWTPELVRDLHERAIAKWNETPFSFGRFAFAGFSEKTEGRQRDSLNVVRWTEPWPYPETWIAVSWSRIDSETGLRYENDIEFNGEKRWAAPDLPTNGRYDVLTTLTHELGHWLRLGHVQEPDHVMHVFQSVNEKRRQLADGDRRGITWIYPSYGSVTTSADSVFFGGEEPDTLVVWITVADRQGRPVAGLSPDRIFVVPEAVSGIPGPLGTNSDRGSFADQLYAQEGTDLYGRTRVVITDARGEGRVRLAVIADGQVLHDQPEIFFSDRDRTVPVPRFTLESVFPNPVLGGPLQVHLRLGQPAKRLLARVIDARGRVVRVLHDAPAPAGLQAITANLHTGGARLSPGIYILDIRTESARETRKLVLLGG